jgi:hypothetical protein
MDITTLSGELAKVAYILLPISPGVFVFSVTLLGSAIERSQNEEKAARENSKSQIDKEISEIDKALSKAKKNGDTTELAGKLLDLKKQRKVFDREIIKIRNKYAQINLINTVLLLVLLFLLLLSLVY